jgi:flagellar basal-body rod protein FlgG
MMRSLWIAKTGMEAQQTQLDVISHNLANVATNGYKRSRGLRGPDLPEPAPERRQTTEQTVLPTGLQIGLGVRPVATARIYTQGNLQQTSNNLDLAIKGDGFFQIQMPDGTTAYTRDGSFQLDANGQMVTSNGYTVLPGITIPNNALSLTIGNDGTVSVTMPARPRRRGGPAPARQLREPGRPGPQGPEPVRRDRRLGHAQHRRAQCQRLGAIQQGLSRPPT